MAKTLAQGRKPGSGRKPGKAKTLAEGRKPGSGRKKGSISKTLADGRKVGSGRKKGSVNVTKENIEKQVVDHLLIQEKPAPVKIYPKIQVKESTATSNTAAINATQTTNIRQIPEEILIQASNAYQFPYEIAEQQPQRQQQGSIAELKKVLDQWET
jgi:hypothetical protein